AKLGDLFTPAGGTKLTGMLAALSQMPEGKEFLDHVAPLLAKGGTTGALVGAATRNPAAAALAGEAAEK
ncbi:hypothetical protein, partial [Pseudomonas putida]|uniref:hypothetical protein n=1 Tax=Pseudomonas putida TaxID=303 RepID=UPI001F528212